MAFSVNTNIASLQAQNYLRTSSDFQSKTINRVTSGLRIVSSGDDAAGLAIANGFRSDEAVLTQGIRNANDGLSTLQTIDGGMNNISQLLDRARTLATQSASGTFTGGASGRAQLNSEFTSVLAEIDRQAQSIGLNQNGEFAKALSVFIGGGKGVSSANVISNGSVSVDLSSSTVDTTSLGLNSLRATNGGYDLGASSNTSVSKILANTTNTGSESPTGTVKFTFTGAGFSDSNKITINVNVAGVKDTDSLITAINSAISTAANPTTAATNTTAFKNAGITASIVTDSDGKQQLAFSAANTAFQVKAGDRAANALMGNIEDTVGTGRTLNTYAVGNAAGASSGTANRVEINGKAYSITLADGDNPATMASKLNTAITADGFSATTENGKIRVEDTTGKSFTIAALDSTTATNFGFAMAATSQVLTTTTAVGGASDTITLAGSVLTVDLSAAATTAAKVTAINKAIHDSTDPTIKGLYTAVLGDAANTWQMVRNDGTAFTLALNAAGATDLNSTTVAGLAGAAGSALTQSTQANSVDSGGASISSQFGDSKAFSYSALASNETQKITFSGSHADGTQYSLDITLAGSTSTSLDTAITNLNTALQASGDSSLKNIVAVKDADSNGALGIRFMSSDDFSVKIGASDKVSGDGLADKSTGAINNGQGAILQSVTSEGSGAVEISNQSAAQNAVSALANAVSALGNAQAVVGKGQNNFNFAVNLAQSQVTNLAAAESRIRDADLASEAANLSKAQILVQAGTAALAQANSAPQAILSLLRG